MNIITVTTRGQIVIPAKVREKLGIVKGTRLAVEENGDELVLKPLTPEYLDSLAGVLKGQDSLSDKLLQERARDRQKEA
jgi:AbrB family looped-hinge helix DNA binding protein